MKLSLLDVCSLAVDSPQRPATFAIILHLEGPKPDPAVLERGALRAMRIFPRSRSFVRGNDWIEQDQAELKIECSEDPAALEEFVARRTDPFRFPLIDQLLCPSPEGCWLLATRMHHAMGDGIALLLWLSAQLREDAGPTLDSRPLRLRRTARTSGGWKKTRSLGPAALGTRTSRRKRWQTLWLDPGRLDDSAPGATLNDLLCSRIFWAIRNWCGKDRPTGSRPLSLWIPMSVRRDPFSHFLNASSRIRLPEAQDPRTVRLRMDEALAQGGWDLGGAAVPLVQGSILSRVPARILQAALSLYFARPAMDPCTSAFSFASRVSRDDDRSAFPGVLRIETIGHLHEAHSFAFSATRFGGTLGLTIFWDPAAVPGQELAEALRAAFQSNWPPPL